MGVFARVLLELAAEDQDTGTLMIDATRPEGIPDGLQPAGPKGGSEARRGRLIGRTKRALNSKLHVVADARGRPILMFVSAGQTSDYIGARALLSSLPAAKVLLADRGYDADWLRETRADRGIQSYSPLHARGGPPRSLTAPSSIASATA